MRHPLRPYQITAIEDLRSAMLAGSRRTVLQLPTGAGKTRIASEIIRLATDNNRRCLFLAPRRELIYQACDALQLQGIRAGIIMAGERPDVVPDVQVASFDTLHARAIQRTHMQMPEADLVIVDEAHLSVAKSRRDILDAYPRARIVGLTATPARGDGRGLGEIYDGMVLGPSVRELVGQGHLVPLRYFAPSKPDLDKLRMNRDGDYAEKGLGERMNDPKLIGGIVENWQRLARDRSTVVFCVNRAHSRAVRDAYTRAGIVAEHLDGETPADERAGILARMASGETQVLCNVFVATYGLDIPRLDCAVLARPTRNITLYLQTLGRVMRTSPGKADALVIDHSGAVDENGFADDIVPWSLDAVEKVKDRKKKQREEMKEPKEIECRSCSYVFRSARSCPSCGHEMIPKSKPIPHYEAQLQEVTKRVTKEDKRRFFGELKSIVAASGKNPGFAAHLYRRRFGVWPNAHGDAPLLPPTSDTQNWYTSQMIRYAKRRSA